MSKHVLVVGAVLLDVIGHARADQSRSQDKIGTVTLAIGGVAFNIATNLTELGHNCQLFTCLRSGSAIGRLVKTSIGHLDIGLDYIIEQPDVPDAAFMAIFSDGEMAALTSSPIDGSDILAGGKLKSAIAKAEIVIADTNLSSDQIRTVHDLCIDMAVDLCLASASDAKADRIAASRECGKTFGLVGMNEQEARRLGFLSDVSEGADDICCQLSAERVLISLGARGAWYIDDHGKHHIPAPEIRSPNVLGAGDALFAATCSCLLRRMRPYANDGLKVVLGAVSAVLGKEGANMSDRNLFYHPENHHRRRDR